jgi:hypothetical protein
MQVPAQPLLGAPPLVDEIVTVIDEQLQITEDCFFGPRPTQIRLSEGGPRDRERVDRVRLAARSAGAPLRRHQLRRHPHDVLPQAKQLPLEPTRQLPAILHRPPTLTAVRRSPTDQRVAANNDGLLVEHLADLVDRNSRHRLLVHVHSDHDHLARLQ